MGKRKQKIAAILLGLICLFAGQTFGEHAPWDCPECGRTGNTWNYCGSCGYPSNSTEEQEDQTESSPENQIFTEEPANNAAVTEEPQQITGYGMTIEDGVFVQNLPSADSVIVDVLPEGQIVSIDAQIYTDGAVWHQVQYDELQGYENRDYTTEVA